MSVKEHISITALSSAEAISLNSSRYWLFILTDEKAKITHIILFTKKVNIKFHKTSFILHHVTFQCIKGPRHGGHFSIKDARFFIIHCALFIYFVSLHRINYN